jgi:hypothetical protein
MFDADNPNVQLLLTRVLQSIANNNTRRIVELLAQEFVDIPAGRLLGALEALCEVGLVSEGASSDGIVYVFNRAGLVLARSWLDRVESITENEGHK